MNLNETAENIKLHYFARLEDMADKNETWNECDEADREAALGLYRAARMFERLCEDEEFDFAYDDDEDKVSDDFYRARTEAIHHAAQLNFDSQAEMRGYKV